MIPTQAVAPSQEEILKQIPTRAHITNRMVAAFKVSLMMLMMLMMLLMLMMMMLMMMTKYVTKMSNKTLLFSKGCHQQGGGRL